jgi:hypothetical protein
MPNLPGGCVDGPKNCSKVDRSMVLPRKDAGHHCFGTSPSRHVGVPTPFRGSVRLPHHTNSILKLAHAVVVVLGGKAPDMPFAP